MTRQTSVVNTKPCANKSDGRSIDYGCSSGNCHCGSSNGTCGCNEGLLVQPHFFAGQLLTDADLQALTNYMVTKQRLHNRFLVGSGVSCGLAVTCHPCGQGKVIIQPGYAIDCCGNEILVPCAVELDINTMARELKFRGLGHDCGDPCADTPATGRAGTRKDRRDSADRYCLYLRYCEQSADPVAPYIQDESCSTNCQPSRLREGFSFELRCPDEEDCPPSFVDRIRCCIGDLDEAELQARNFERSQLYLQRAKTGLRAYSLDQMATFTDDDVMLVSVTYKQLDDFRSSPTKDISDKSEISGEKALRRSLDNVQTLGSAIARWKLLDKDKQNDFLKKNKDLPDIIRRSPNLLNEVEQKIRKQARTFSTSIELAAANATLDNTLQYIDPKLQKEDLRTKEAVLYTYNSSTNRALNNEINKALENFKNWLLRKMHRCPPTTECSLIKEVTAVAIPMDDTISEATMIVQETLVRAFTRYLLDCICSALIPPCPTCEDPAVKLACLEVKDCEVDNVCNLERSFLLTQHNLRYWLPFLHWFGEALEKVCCEFSKSFDYLPTYQPQLNRNTDYFVLGQQVSKTIAAEPAYHHILRITGLSGASVNSTINLGNSLSNVLVHQPQITGLFEPFIRQPRVKAVTPAETENEFREIAKLANRIEVAEDGQERSNARLKKLENVVSSLPTTSKLASTTVIRNLQASLHAVTEANKELRERLEKLEKEDREK